MATLDSAIIEIVDTVCSSVLGFEALPKPPGASGRGMLARMNVAGAWSGSVAVWCDEEFARACATVLFEGEPCGDPEARDALGELANIIAGNLKALLPSPSRISLPIVSSDETVPSELADDRIAFHVAGRHHLEVSVVETRAAAPDAA